MPKDTLSITPSEEAEKQSIYSYFDDGKILRYSKGDTVISGMNEPDGVYIIKKGFIKAYTNTKDGQENLLLVHKAGEFIPLTWALDGSHSEGLYYDAISDVIMLKTTKEKLRSAIADNKWLAQDVLKQSVRIITTYSDRIQALEHRTARGRIVAELLNLAEMFGKTDGKKVLLDVPVTHQDIANSINMTRETATRALGLLFDENLLGQEDHLFTILDLPKLEKEVS